jgi:hypothetical protein
VKKHIKLNTISLVDVVVKKGAIMKGFFSYFVQHVKLRPLLFTVALFISLSLLAHIAKAAEPNWITTDKGCKVWNPYPKPNESVTWSGKCIDGKAHGYGVLQWYRDGFKTLRQEFTPTSGARMENGIAIATVESSSVNFQITECQKERKDKQGVQWYESFRVVRGDVTKDIDLGHPIVVEKILSMAEQFVWRECPAKAPFSANVSLSNVNVYLYQNNELAVRARSYPKMIGGVTHYDKTEWREFSNYVLKKRLAEVEAMRRAEEQKAIEARKKIEEEKKRLEMEAKKAREDRERIEIRKRYAEFVKKNGVQAWPSCEELSTNPFVFEGKTVAIVAYFERMLSATKGLFRIFFSGGSSEAVAVSNIPKGLFRKEGQVVLAGRVLGRTEGILHLEFVGVYFCKNTGCSDILP